MKGILKEIKKLGSQGKHKEEELIKRYIDNIKEESEEIYIQSFNSIYDNYLEEVDNSYKYYIKNLNSIVETERYKEIDNKRKSCLKDIILQTADAYDLSPSSIICGELIERYIIIKPNSDENVEENSKEIALKLICKHLDYIKNSTDESICKLLEEYRTRLLEIVKHTQKVVKEMNANKTK
jgi:hypothetical protein